MRFPWVGKCIGGLYVGVRSFARSGATVRGVFGMEGVSEPCAAPVTARCQLSEGGKLLPFFWLACDDPEHRKDAGVVQHLDEKGFVVGETRMLMPPMPELPPIRVEVPPEAVEVLGAPRRRRIEDDPRKGKKRPTIEVGADGEVVKKGPSSHGEAPRSTPSSGRTTPGCPKPRQKRIAKNKARAKREKVVAHG